MPPRRQYAVDDAALRQIPPAGIVARAANAPSTRDHFAHLSNAANLLTTGKLLLCFLLRPVKAFQRQRE